MKEKALLCQRDAAPWRGGAVWRRWRRPIFLAAFPLAYFLAAKIGVATSMPPEGIVIVWPANAIVLAALLSVERKHWWITFAATVAAEIAAAVPAYPFWASAGYGTVNFFEGALAALLLSGLSKGRPRIVELGDFIRFLALVPVLSCGAAALFGAAIYKLGNPAIEYLHYWRIFWFGDAMGMLVVGTTLLAWRRPRGSRIRRDALFVAEGALLSLGLSAAWVWALAADETDPRLYLIFPFLVWAGIRFGVHGASAAIVTTTAVAVGSAVTGHGPFVAQSHIDGVIALQGMLTVCASLTFMLAFSTDASRRFYNQLAALNQELDETVREKTSYLHEALRRNELLLAEIRHRVGNNLQIMANLIRSRGRSLSSPAERRAFIELENQISAIAATYALLQQMESENVVDLCRIVPELCRHIQESHGPDVSISHEVHGDGVISADTAVVVSLAINELMTNSIKHSPGGRPVAISVICAREADQVTLKVSDDGPGFPPGFNLEGAKKGSGMRMVHGLLKQSGGEVRTGGSPGGATVELIVPAAHTEGEPIFLHGIGVGQNGPRISETPGRRSP